MLLTRKKLKPKYGRSTIIKPVIIHGLDGINGINGLDGLPGIKGEAIKGDQGSKGDKGSSIKGDKGNKGEKGNSGLAGRGIKSVEMFSRVMRIHYTDGTTEEIKLSRPAGTVNNPGYGTGGMEPPVQDVRGGTNIEVLKKNRTFTVNEKANTVGYGLPYYNIPENLDYEVPINQHHLTIGEVTINGSMLVSGEMAVT